MGIEIQQVTEDTPWQLRQLYYTLSYMQINSLGWIQHALALCVKWVIAVGSLSVSLPGAVGSLAICSLIICFRRDLGLGNQMVSPIPPISRRTSINIHRLVFPSVLPSLGLCLDGGVKYRLLKKIKIKRVELLGHLHTRIMDTLSKKKTVSLVR